MNVEFDLGWIIGSIIVIYFVKDFLLELLEDIVNIFRRKPEPVPTYIPRLKVPTFPQWPDLPRDMSPGVWTSTTTTTEREFEAGEKYMALHIVHQDYSGQDFEGTVFDGCIFEYVTFRECDCRNVNFINCQFNNVYFPESDLEGAQFINCNGPVDYSEATDTRNMVIKTIETSNLEPTKKVTRPRLVRPRPPKKKIRLSFEK
jgi:hypothetical protein